LLADLHRQGKLERLHVWSKDRPLPAYRIDPARLEALARELES
jgi:hypothetical protein